MTNNINDPFAQNLVGLWDFLSSGPRNDTGLVDGIAQNGTLVGGANISGGRLHTDGHNDYFDVDGNGGPNDAPFDLSEGTVSVQFTQSAHKGSSPDTLVNRGEYCDRAHEGWFGMQVTAHGAVTVQHVSNGQDVTLSTNNGFFSPGDLVKATYSWSASDGLTFTVQNLTDGTEQTVSSSQTGLDFDIGDNDDENFTFAAREFDDGTYDEEFFGAIDYVAVYNIDVLNAEPQPDGAVNGEEFGEVMELGYDDGNAPTDQGGDVITNNADLIFGNGGDDTIDGEGGNDTIYGGSDDDVIEGNSGDDLIYGDNGVPVEPVLGNPTTLDISDLSGGRIVSEDGAVTTDVSLGGFIQTTSSSTFGKVTPDNVFYSGPEVGGSRNTLDLDFDTPVSDVSFTIFDVNSGSGWDDQVRIIALDADGNQLPVTFSGTNVNTGGVDVRGNTIDGSNNNTTFRLDANNPDNVQVQIEGPISSLQVIHEPGNDTSSVIGWIGVGDIDVTPILDAGGPGGTPSSDDGGDDVIDGGTGEDTIFGEGGNDTIDGGADDDLIYGDNGVPVEPVPSNPTTLDISDLSGGRIVSEDGAVTTDVSLGGFIQTTSSSTFGKATPDNVFYSGPEVGGSRNTLDLDFDTPVSDVSFTIFDVNSGSGWDDQVRIIALDADGNQLPVTFSGTNVNTGGVDVRGNTIDGSNNNTTFRLDANNPDNVQVQIEGPISSLQVIHEPGNDTSSVIGWIGVGDIDVTPIFDPTGGNPSSGDGGDDVLDGGDGEDTIFGEGGDDTIDGGADDDLIYGDSNEDLTGTGSFTGPRESFNWDLVSGTQADSSVVQDTGDVNVTYSRITDTGAHESDIDNSTPLNTDGIDSGSETIDTNSSLSSITNGNGNEGAFQWEFDEPVGNVEFNVNDLDADGVVTITAYGPDGVTEIPVQLVGGSDVVVNGNVATAIGPYQNDNDPDINVQVTIPGPVSRIVLEHEQIGSDNSGIHITDMYFDTGFEPGNDGQNGEGGDDVITGGEGADTMFGEGGNDTFLVGSAEEGAGDVIDGGNGPDETTDFDVLDLRGAGPVTIDEEVDDNDEGATEGTVTFEDGSTLTFEGIEEILTDPDNAAPVANDDTITVAEDGDVTFDPTANDTDPDGDPVTVDSFTQPANGTVTQNPDGTLTYTPDPDYNGPDSFEVTVTDPDGLTSTSTVDVDVTPVGDAPVAVDDAAVTDEDTPIVIDPTANDSDPDGDPVTLDSFTQPANGTVTQNPDGTLTYTPDPDYNGPDSFEVTVTDPDGLTSTSTVDVTVNPVNDAPEAADDVAQTDEDTPVVIDVLQNDTDPDGDPVTLDSFTQPANGTVTENPDGTLTYTPDPNFNGADSFEVTVTDPDGLTSTSTVDVAVVSVDELVAVDDTATTEEDTPVTIDVVANDENPDGGVPTIIDATVPADQGTVEIVGNQLVFTPAPDFNGDATITYTIEDEDGLTDTATAVVDVTPVNDAPEAVDDTATTEEDTPVTINVLANDTDPENDPLTVVEATVPAEQGTVEIVGNQVVFTPAEDFTGEATITYVIEDEDGAQDIADAVVTVTPVNDAPDAVDDTATTEEDTPVTINVLANDTDPENDPLTVVDATVPPEQGTVQIIGNQVVFTPAEDFTGEATITYTVEDDEGLQDTADVAVTVTPVEDAPDAVDDTATTEEDTPVTINVLANDTDPENDPLSVVDATVPADQGTVEIIGNQVVFTPAEDFTGEATITYTVEDDEGLQDTADAVVTVTPVNDAPDAVDDSDITDEDTPITVDLLANDSDVDGDTISVVEATLTEGEGTIVDNGDGTVTYTPAPDFNGQATITYTITDGVLTDTATHEITVNAEGDAPVTVDDVAETDEDTPVVIDPLANDSDPDGQPLTFAETPTSPDGTVEINPDGTITFTPDPDFNGPTTIDYIAEDPDGNQTPGTITVDVAPVNDAPDAVNDAVETDEETPVTIDVLANDTDPDDDPLTVTAASVPTEQGTVEIVDNELVFTPAEDFFGEATISYSIEDGNGGTDVAEVVVTVNNVNDDPVAVDDIASTDEDTPVTIDVLDNDEDADGDPLTITDATVPADQGTVEIVDNELVFTPAPDFNGPATITYTVDDGQGGTDEGEATVNVGAVNDGPTAVDDTETTDEDTPVTIDVLGNDTDPDSDPLTITAATVPADQGTVEIVGNELVFTPAENFNGEATIDYSITDGNGGTDSAVVTVTVTPVNDDPVAVDDIENTDEDTPVIVDLLGNDSDVDGDDLTLADVSVPADQGTVVDNGDGTVTFTPAPDFNGPATITYTVDDGNGGTDEGEATVNVGAVNDSPVAEDDSASTPEDTPITLDVLDNDSDPDGDTLRIVSATVPAEEGTVEIVDDELVFTPAENFNGEATITYTISDGNGLTDTADVVVTVTPEGDAPVTVDDVAETDEDTPVVIDPLANDSDPDGQPLTFAETPTSPDGTVEINPDGTITFTPDPDFNGPTTIDYIAEDPDGNQTPGTITVTVAPVEDAPVTVDDVAETDEDTPVIIDPLANDSDPDGDTLEIAGTPVAENGTVTVNPDGTIEYTPDPDFNGTDTITYFAEDPDGNQTEGTITVTVAPINDAPDAVDDRDVTTFNTPVTIAVLDNDTDVDGDDLTVIAADSPDGTANINPDGTITFTPTDGFEGEATVTYTIEDEEGLQDTATVLITVGDDPRDGIVSGTDDGELIDETYDGDPDGDFVDNDDAILPGEVGDDDIIQAGGGNDTIDAGEGNDDVFAGTGDDQVHGGPGDDILRGEEGDDSINGGAGDDTIDGGDDDDVINGGDGSDSILGGDGNDSITSSDPDNDLLVDAGYPGVTAGEEGTPEADNERDFVDGGAGDDTISTGDDADTIVGGTGDDVIDGGIDDDVIDGDDTTNPTEGGADRIVGGEGNDLIDGGVGNDTIYAGNDPDLGLDILNIEDDGTNPFGPDLRPDNGRDTVSGGEGDDLIFGADDDDVLSGDEGNDTIDGGIDDDIIDGGVGNDSLLGGQGDDTIEGGDGQDTLLGGIGADDMSGGADEDLFDDVNAGDTVDGGAGVTTGEDFDTLDLRGSAPAGGSFTVEITGPDSNGNGVDGVVNYFDADGNDAGTLTFSEIEEIIPCFTPGTMIATASGERPVQDLKVGDRIITRDNGIQEIRWVGQREMTGDELNRAAHLRPVLIRQGALGKGLPERDMLVSPQHRVLMASDKTALYFDEAEVLVAAKHLTDMDGIDVVEVSGTTYIHVMFEQHEVILSDGAWTESFQPGDQTLSAMSDAVRAEILELFPELETEMGIKAYAAARRSLKKHEAKLLSQ